MKMGGKVRLVLDHSSEDERAGSPARSSPATARTRASDFPRVDFGQKPSVCLEIALGSVVGRRNLTPCFFSDP